MTPQPKALSVPVRVLVVDDEKEHAEVVAEGLDRIGCRCDTAFSGEEALALLDEGQWDVVITDIRMGRVSGLEVVERAHDRLPEAHVVVLTAHGTFEIAVEAMSRGADTCLKKPINLGELRATVERFARGLAVQRENEDLRRQLDAKFGFEGILGESLPMQRVFETLRQISPTDATVLIQGESGVGKDLAARAIHHNSPRRRRNFVGLNCAALSESILESELFGHERGAFTGAHVRRLGRFEYADGGTLFLDEVADMPLSTQIKLLRVIEDREITRVGSNEPLKVDVRLITATNQDLRECVGNRTFREDLYFRLNVVRLDIPPLRERRGDTPLLIEAFIKEFAGRHGKPVEGITREARTILDRYPWPGNVRELKNTIESMIVVSSSPTLDVADIPTHIHATQTEPDTSVGGLVGLSLEDVEQQLIRRTLESCDGNREQTARILGIAARTLYRKLDRYGLK